MYRFFVDREQIFQETIKITGKDVNHIKNVLRMKIGEKLLISDGEDREYSCSIKEIKNSEITARILDVDGPERELPVRVTLFQALPKGDKMETIIQKTVELGVFRIVPVMTKRCIVKLDEKKSEIKTKRWNAVAESAAKQSKRGMIPQVSKPMDFKSAIETAVDMDKFLIPYEEADNMQNTRAAISEIKSGMEVAVFIGPEGGFAQEEIESAANMGALPITLGKRKLRTETAGMALMSVIMFAMEE